VAVVVRITLLTPLALVALAAVVLVVSLVAHRPPVQPILAAVAVEEVDNSYPKTATLVALA
jgi:hypothetical protein